MLSRFAGAAEEMTAALLTNPYHCDGMAVDLDQALRMEDEERMSRHRELAALVWRGTVDVWANDFLAALAAAPPPRLRERSASESGF
jgi:trehalose 6-phosphate synthase